MSHWSVEIESPAELSDWLSWLIAERLDVAVEIQDEETFIQGPEEDTSRLIVRIEKMPTEEMINALHDCLSEVGCMDCPVRTQKNDDTDWRLGWRAFFSPTMIAPNIIARPPWSEESDEDHLDVIIDPGLAFGTGTHATTQLAATLCAEVLRHKSPCRVLDQGCGSGILTVLCAKLGHYAHGVELDPVAANNARENIKLNRFTDDQIKITTSDEVPKASFDVVVVNIIAPVLIELASNLKAACGETLILSGLLVDQEKSVLKVYTGWVVQKRITQGHWVGLILQRVSTEVT